MRDVGFKGREDRPGRGVPSPVALAGARTAQKFDIVHGPLSGSGVEADAF